MLLASFLQRPGLPFADALREEAIQKVFDDQEAAFAEDEDAAYTPLTDAEKYAKDYVAELYHCRWVAALNIGAIKNTMGMDILRCKTPEMVRKET